MAIDIKVPSLGESVSEATVARWFKKPGEKIEVDEPIVELETDKVTVEVNAASSGHLSSIAVNEGNDVEVGALLGTIDESGRMPASGELEGEHTAMEPTVTESQAKSGTQQVFPMPNERSPDQKTDQLKKHKSERQLSPAVRKLVDDNNLNDYEFLGTGKAGRVTKGDVLSVIQNNSQNTVHADSRVIYESEKDEIATIASNSRLSARPQDPREERVKITKLRKIISARLKEAQNTAAMLTTWNEVDMGAAMDLRSKYKESFEKKHGVRLGFMSYFVRAACIALKEWPSINAELYGDELIYKNFL